jgi:hypothetical protein
MKVKSVFAFCFALLVFVFIYFPIERVKIIKISRWWLTIDKVFPLILNTKSFGAIEIGSHHIVRCSDCGEQNQIMILTADFQKAIIEDERKKWQGGIKILGNFRIANVSPDGAKDLTSPSQDRNSKPLFKINFVATEPTILGFSSNYLSQENENLELISELGKRGFQNFPVHYFNDFDLCHFGRFYKPKAVRIVSEDDRLSVTLEAGEISLNCLKELFVYENYE